MEKRKGLWLMRDGQKVLWDFIEHEKEMLWDLNFFKDGWPEHKWELIKE